MAVEKVLCESEQLLSTASSHGGCSGITLNATQLEVAFADVGLTLLRLCAKFFCMIAVHVQTAIASTVCSSRCYPLGHQSTFCLK